MRILSICLLLALGACGPTLSTLQLPENCRAAQSRSQLIAGNWRQQPHIWRLRQAALLEIGSKKIPLEGFLRLDLRHKEARLLALNEMGLVLFDLQVTEQGEVLHRAIPQIREHKAVARGVAQSLRRIFLQPLPEANDLLQTQGNSQGLRRSLSDGQLEFIFDCSGDLRETRQQAKSGEWQVIYNDYRDYAGARLPEEILFNDETHRVKLSLWQKEVKQEL
ncbi:lipoprotein insertase outer membrane protein LolB [Geopsychrobacter electrodiphilus]|uniref:lipoprotein insertase outer membrane protein LolB n=1 Tax=Geopsychrobacter electrodiphilus TaxID=225196 RepID=UPI00035F6CFC|nr:lipoprotein insertase outer membrane protein LolB [Geopsychrobacter electrodiphilus]